MNSPNMDEPKWMHTIQKHPITFVVILFGIITALLLCDYNLTITKAESANTSENIKATVFEKAIAHTTKENINNTIETVLTAAYESQLHMATPSVEAVSETIVVGWTPVKIADKYEIVISDENNETLDTVSIEDAEQTSYTFENLPTEATYRISMSASADIYNKTYTGNQTDSVDIYLKHIPSASELANQNLGSAGRLVIPDVGIDVALYYADDAHSQTIVNNTDSAALLTEFGNGNIIADHWNQGFDGIKSASVNNTVAYIGNGNSTKQYLCTSKFTGHNTEYDLTDNNYNSIVNSNNNGLIMYTCNDDWTNITITYWTPM